MKSLKISKEAHTLLKVYCATKGLKINSWVENLILKKIKKNI
jgi:predicted HicB family RNase H-like nuclease